VEVVRKLVSIRIHKIIFVNHVTIIIAILAQGRIRQNAPNARQPIIYIKGIVSLLAILKIQNMILWLILEKFAMIAI